VIQTESNGVFEQSWIGNKLQIGDVKLEVSGPTERCVMTNLDQDDHPYDREILKCIGQEFGLNFGVYAKVLQAGSIRSHDQVFG